MQKSTFKFDARKARRMVSGIKSHVRARAKEVGEEAVQYAVENGTYRDVTGRLRRSNHYEVDQNGNLTLYNDAPYADDVESRGHDVISGAALYAESQLRK